MIGQISKRLSSTSVADIPITLYITLNKPPVPVDHLNPEIRLFSDIKLLLSILTLFPFKSNALIYATPEATVISFSFTFSIIYATFNGRPLCDLSRQD